MIAEVGRWVNLLDADPAKRAANLARDRWAGPGRGRGARCCVDIAGSFIRPSGTARIPRNLTPEFFDAAVENARKIIDAVQPRRTKFCLRDDGLGLARRPRLLPQDDQGRGPPGVRAFTSTPATSSTRPQRFYHNTALSNECFDKLGPWIVSCHAKDLTWDVEMNIHFREVAHRRGPARLRDLPQTSWPPCPATSRSCSST